MTWISVKDRLPKLDEIVIILIDYGPNREGRPTPLRVAFGARLYDDGEGWWEWGLVEMMPFVPANEIVIADDDYPVTHWMPLPEMPK